MNVTQQLSENKQFWVVLSPNRGSYQEYPDYSQAYNAAIKAAEQQVGDTYFLAQVTTRITASAIVGVQRLA